MHLAVPGVAAYLYHIQHALSQAGTDRAWLSPAFHREIADSKILTEQKSNPHTHFVKIVCREPTHLEFCDASGLGAREVLLDPSRSWKDLLRRHPWPAEIIYDLVSSTNREGTIKNSDLELVALVLHKATLLTAVLEARLVAPCSGLYNIPTVSWSKKEASTINPVVADLFALHLSQFFLNPYIFITQASRIEW